MQQLKVVKYTVYGMNNIREAVEKSTILGSQRNKREGNPPSFYKLNTTIIG